MPSGSLEVTLVSASISPYTPLESEPCDTYAILKCINEQQRTQNARDQGRLPVWNETFNFDIQEEYMSGDLLVQVFNIRSGADELLGTGRIPLFSMVGKDEATLCSLGNPGQGEIGKVKAIWKWKPGSQASLKSSSYREGNMSGHQGSWESAGYSAYDSKVPPHENVSGPVAYPHVITSTNSGSERYSKLEAVSDAMAKLSMEKGSQKYAAPYPEDSSNFGKEERAPGGEYYSYPPPASGQYPVEHAPTSESCARGGSDYGYPPPVGAYPPSKDAYAPNKDEYPPRSSGSYPPAADAYPSNSQGYPAYPASAYPPPEAGAYPPQSGAYPPPPGAYPPNKEGYPPYPGSANPTYSDPYASSDVSSEGSGYMERGGGMKQKGGSGKDKEKGHGSHTPYGQAPPAGYPPSSYPPPNAGYSPYGHPPPGGYPPAPHGYPPAQHGYPPAPQGYPPAPQGYPSAPHGYPPAGYPPQGYPPAHAPPGYTPHGYPASGHESHGHKPDKYGHAAGAYVGHSSSSSKPSKKHKEPKDSSSHKHSKHKKQKSFKGMKFKKFKMFKF